MAKKLVIIEQTDGSYVVVNPEHVSAITTTKGKLNLKLLSGKDLTISLKGEVDTKQAMMELSNQFLDSPPQPKGPEFSFTDPNRPAVSPAYYDGLDKGAKPNG